MTHYEKIVNIETLPLESNSYKIKLKEDQILRYDDECWINLVDKSKNDVELVLFNVKLSGKGIEQTFGLETIINRSDKRKYLVDFILKEETFPFSEIEISIDPAIYKRLKNPVINFRIQNVYN